METHVSGEKPQRLVEDEAVPKVVAPVGAAAPLSTLDKIRAARDVVDSVDVDVPEWGVVVKIRGLTRGEIQRSMADWVGKSPDPELVNARSMAMAMIDPAVTLEEAQEILETKSMGPTARITQAIMEASGMGEGFLQT